MSVKADWSTLLAQQQSSRGVRPIHAVEQKKSQEFVCQFIVSGGIVLEGVVCAAGTTWAKTDRR